ncbi:hypothetical protein [Borrelia miyamotoi]|uniref:hypothetical protein n=1 Tax=Borrelia miyamotoi TaxID=47466 RepID=UPI0012EA9124
MTLFLLFSCISGQLESEKFVAENKNNFLDLLVKIGQGFQKRYLEFLAMLLGMH